MKDSRLSYLVPVGAAIALLVLALMAYAGLLTSEWATLFRCVPAILAMTGIVAGMIFGMFFFDTEEGETTEEATHMDGTALFDLLGAGIGRFTRRIVAGLHLRSARR